MDILVYKLTRQDGLEYIGITKRLYHRIFLHKQSMRFKEFPIVKVEILANCDDYSLAEKLEEEYIQQFDTYKNGLNLTKNGKGREQENIKFNTLGMRHSPETIAKIKAKHWKTKGMDNPFKGRKHKDETKEVWSKKRRGRAHGYKKLSYNLSLEILDAYQKDSLEFTKEFIAKFVKASQRDVVGIVSFENLKSPNGRPLTKKTLYAHHYAGIYNITPNNIRRLLEFGACPLINS